MLKRHSVVGVPVPVPRKLEQLECGHGERSCATFVGNIGSQRHACRSFQLPSATMGIWALAGLKKGSCI